MENIAGDSSEIITDKGFLKLTIGPSPTFITGCEIGNKQNKLERN